MAAVAPSTCGKRDASSSPLGGDMPCHKKERVAWAAAMRTKLSPQDMLNEDGAINQEFFKPKKVVLKVDRKWGDMERDKLSEGLATLGVGAWREIVARLLPRWDENTVRIKVRALRVAFRSSSHPTRTASMRTHPRHPRYRGCAYRRRRIRSPC